ncbi:MAG: methyltransferase domain-containing protein, partial [Bacteroidota bacterium]
AANLPWSDHQFDHIYVMWFLEHLPSPFEVLQEAKRVKEIAGNKRAGILRESSIIQS